MRRPWLAGLVPLYAAGAGLRRMGLALGLERVERLQRPVVSIGNISAGGAGKTPFTVALARLLATHGVQVDVLSRGYGRTGTGAARVVSGGSAGEFGDEPLLIAEEAGVPVFLAARRIEAGRLAESEGQAAVHLLDDGFQHRQLHRDVDIVLVSSEDLGDSLLPAGNLREPRGALRRATAFAVVAGDEAAAEALARMNAADGLPGRPIWRYSRRMSVPAVGGPVVAFCGIARPEQFFAGLAAAGVAVAGRRVFADHHRFTAEDASELASLALSVGTRAFVTTGKDRVRLGGLGAPLWAVAPVAVAGLTVELAEPDAVALWLLRQASAGTP